MNLLIVDDHQVFRKAFICLLSTLFDPSPFCVEAANGLSALNEVKSLNFDAVFLDISMPEMDGYEAFDQIMCQENSPRVIILTQFEDRVVIAHFLRHGACAFLTKNANPDQIKEALSVALSGEAKILTSPDWETTDPNCVEVSKQQRKLIKLLSEGYSSKEIASHLGVTLKTVKTYRERILRKTETKNVAELIAHAYKTGLIT